MFSAHPLWLLTGLVFLINLPFGFWRAGTRRFSGSWFAAIHLPVVLAIGLRVAAGVRLMIPSVALFAGAFFLGQSFGGRLRSPRRHPRQTRPR